jgi:hypothetical protein
LPVGVDSRGSIMDTEERWQVVVEQRLALAELLAGL